MSGMTTAMSRICGSPTGPSLIHRRSGIPPANRAETDACATEPAPPTELRRRHNPVQRPVLRDRWSSPIQRKQHTPGQSRRGMADTKRGAVSGLHQLGLIADRALKPQERDRFAHDDFVVQLEALICSGVDTANIALFGSWGAGKS